MSVELTDLTVRTNITDLGNMEHIVTYHSEFLADIVGPAFGNQFAVRWPGDSVLDWNYAEFDDALEAIREQTQ